MEITLTHNRQCKICNTTFYNKNGRASLCDSEKCRNEQKRINNIAYARAKQAAKPETSRVKCLICELEFSSLIGHISDMHGMSSKEYKEKFPGAPTVCKDLHAKFSESMIGEKNPGYQHNGKFSSWSDKSTKHTKEQITESKKKAKDNYTKDKRSTNTEYWTKQGFSEEEAIQKVSERQTTFSKEICIEKHGEEEGLRIFTERQNKWQKNLNDKPLDEIKRINQLKAWSGGSTSKGEQALVAKLREYHNDIECNIQITSKINVDILLGKKVIEYYGDYWHMNPIIYDEDRKNKSTNLLAREKWESDSVRIQALQDLGYKVKIVWEKDCREDHSTILEECLQFLNE